MICECFYFYNELDLLDLKLHEGRDIIDKFVLCEFRTNLLHKPQRLFYEENKDRFSDFHDKIIHIIGEDSHPGLAGHGLFAARKELYMQGLQNCKPNDIIISSDPDVVMKKSAFDTIENMNLENHEVQFIHDWYCYFMDYMYTGAKFGFNGANLYKNIHAGRWATIYRWKPVGYVVNNAGYHFSKLGGVDAIIENISGYPHQECNIPMLKDRNNIQYKIDHGLPWDSNLAHNPPVVMQHIPYDPENYPEYLNQHPEIYSKYFKEGMK